MGEKLFIGLFFVFILTPISFVVAKPIGAKKANEISATIIEMEWNQIFGGTGNEGANSLIQTADGGFALAGYTTSYGAAGDYSDMWLVKTDASGQAKWFKAFGGTEDEGANSLIQTTDGGYALAGYTTSYGAREYDIWLVKTDASGQAEWSQAFGGGRSSGANSLIQTTDGGYALAGYIATDTGLLIAPRDMWLIKINSPETTSMRAWTRLILLISITGLLILSMRKTRK